MASNLDPVFDAAGAAFNVDPGILRGIAHTESSGNPSAVSPKGARGLMGIMPATAAGLAVNSADPVQSIWGAANLVAQNIKQFGNVPDALRAYNAGPNPSHWTNPETAAYVGRVANNYQPGALAPAQSDSVPADPEPSPMPAAQPATPPQAGQDAYSVLFGATAPADAPAAPTPVLTAPASFPTVPPRALQPGEAGYDPASPVMTNLSPADHARMVAGQGPAPAQSGDAYTQIFGATDPDKGQGDVKAAWHQGTALGNFAHGVGRAAYNVDSAIGRGTMAVVDAIPGVQGVLAGTGLDPANLGAFDQQKTADYQANYGASPGAQAGQFTGNALMMAGAGAGATGLVGLGGGLAADAVGGTAGRLIQAGTNVLTGAGGATRGARIGLAATSGAAQGGGVTAATGGSGQDVATNALIGAGMGPIALAVAPAVGFAGRKIAGSGNALLDAIAPADAAATPIAANANGAPVNALTSAQAAPPGAAAAAPTDASVQPESAPPKISLGVIPNPANAPDLAQQVYDHYAAGGPTALVKSQIPGVSLTAAQATGNANLARLEGLMRDQEPNAFNALEQSNGTARTAYAHNVIGTPDMIDAAEAARDAATTQAREAAFTNAQPVDAQPALDHVASLIADNAGRPTVQQPLLAVQKQLAELAPEAEDGGRMADPTQLYNLRKYLGDMIAPRASGTANDGQAAATQLMALKPTLDDSIESGAPGFKNYIGQFDQLSRPIDAMRYLQSKNLVNPDGVVQRAKIDSLLKNIQSQQNAPGYKMADSVTPEQIQALTALRDDMNLANRSNLGKSLGSNTAQNLFVAGKTNALISGAGGHLASALAGGLGATEAGPMGVGAGFAMNALRGAYAGRVAATQQAAKAALLGKLLNPYAGP